MDFSRDRMRAELIRDEGLKLMPYTDTLGLLTIGVGRCIGTRGISEAEALILLDNDIADIVRAFDHLLPWWRSLSDARQRALINMGMMGVGSLMDFHKMLAALQSGDWAAAAREALDSKWAHQVGDRARRVSDMFLHG